MCSNLPRHVVRPGPGSALPELYLRASFNRERSRSTPAVDGSAPEDRLIDRVLVGAGFRCRRPWCRPASAICPPGPKAMAAERRTGRRCCVRSHTSCSSRWGSIESTSRDSSSTACRCDRRFFERTVPHFITFWKALNDSLLSESTTCRGLADVSSGAKEMTMLVKRQRSHHIWTPCLPAHCRIGTICR